MDKVKKHEIHVLVTMLGAGQTLTRVTKLVENESNEVRSRLGSGDGNNQ